MTGRYLLKHYLPEISLVGSNKKRIVITMYKLYNRKLKYLQIFQKKFKYYQNLLAQKNIYWLVPCRPVLRVLVIHIKFWNQVLNICNKIDLIRKTEPYILKETHYANRLLTLTYIRKLLVTNSPNSPSICFIHIDKQLWTSSDTRKWKLKTRFTQYTLTVDTCFFKVDYSRQSDTTEP